MSADFESNDDITWCSCNLSSRPVSLAHPFPDEDPLGHPGHEQVPALRSLYRHLGHKETLLTNLCQNKGTYDTIRYICYTDKQVKVSLTIFSMLVVNNPLITNGLIIFVE